MSTHTKTPKSPIPSRLTIDSCRSALDTLERSPNDAQARQLLARHFPDVFEHWEADVYGPFEGARCTDCQIYFIFNVRAAHHLARCTEHPAIVRFEAARQAVRIAGLQAPPELDSIRLPPHERLLLKDTYTIRSALDALVGATKPEERGTAIALLREVVVQWCHRSDRDSDPCPWCGATMRLDSMLAHLRSCTEHPATLCANQLARVTRLPNGIWTLAYERVFRRHELFILERAVTEYLAEMGWTGEAGYSDATTEAPFLAAVSRAARYVGTPEFTTRQRDEANAGKSEVRSALKRLLDSPVNARDANDLTRLNAAFVELEQWSSSHTFATTCPACGRKGIPRVGLARHLETCPMHEPVKRARARAAVGLLLSSEVTPPATVVMGEFDPDHFRDRAREYLHDCFREALSALASAVPPAGSDSRRELWSLVRDWEDMQALANGPCPWCQQASIDPAHLIQCTAFPAAPEIASCTSDFAERAVALRADADRCLVATARLCEAAYNFFNGMSDDEGGKSISNPRIEAMLNDAHRAAKEVLATVKFSPV